MGNNVITAQVKICGLRPLLWNAFSATVLSRDKGERPGVAGNNPEEWRSSCLFDADTRQMYLPTSYIFGCLREAARYSKVGRSSYQTRLAATLMVVEERILIDRFLPDEIATDASQPVYLDIRMVRNPATRARNIRYRVACSPGWRCGFTLEWDTALVNRNIMEAIVIDAGRLAGIGDGRALGLGRFDVEEFKVIETRLQGVTQGA